MPNITKEEIKKEIETKEDIIGNPKDYSTLALYNTFEEIYNRTEKQTEARIKKDIEERIRFMKSPEFVMVEKDQKYAELNRNRMINILQEQLEKLQEKK